MSARQTRRFFIVAFVLSLLVHLVAVVFIRPYDLPEDEAAPSVIHVLHVHVTHIARVQTPPPPTPSPVPSAAPTAGPPHRTIRRRSSPNGMLPAAVATASPGPVSQPSQSPRASATPNCAGADSPVVIAATAAPPDIPAAARAAGGQKGGTTAVRVVVDANGKVSQADVTQSSGAPALDAIAIEMARSAQYTAAMHKCKPVASEFAYTVQFAPW